MKTVSFAYYYQTTTIYWTLLWLLFYSLAAYIIIYHFPLQEGVAKGMILLCLLIFASVTISESLKMQQWRKAGPVLKGDSKTYSIKRHPKGQYEVYYWVELATIRVSRHYLHFDSIDESFMSLSRRAVRMDEDEFLEQIRLIAPHVKFEFLTH